MPVSTPAPYPAQAYAVPAIHVCSWCGWERHTRENCFQPGGGRAGQGPPSWRCEPKKGSPAHAMKEQNRATSANAQAGANLTSTVDFGNAGMPVHAFSLPQLRITTTRTTIINSFTRKPLLLRARTGIVERGRLCWTRPLPTTTSSIARRSRTICRSHRAQDTGRRSTLPSPSSASGTCTQSSTSTDEIR